MSKVDIGDFRNFCLDSCCKYKLRLNTHVNLAYFGEWLIEGFIINSSMKYFLVYKTFKTITESDVVWSEYYQKTFINTVEEVKKTLEDMSRK